MIHLQYLSNDSLAVFGNHFHRARDVGMKREFAFVVSFTYSYILSYSHWCKGSCLWFMQAKYEFLLVGFHAHF